MFARMSLRALVYWRKRHFCETFGTLVGV